MHRLLKIGEEIKTWDEVQNDGEWVRIPPMDLHHMKKDGGGVVQEDTLPVRRKV